MTRQRRLSRPPRPLRTRVRNDAPSTPKQSWGRSSYDPLSLWPSHIGTGAYAEPGSLAATAHDLNWLINWPDALHAALWVLWRITMHRDGVRTIHVPANRSYSVNDVRAEWARLHIPSCILAMSNGGMTILVGARQERWAKYVLGRLLAGESVPAWTERR